jgi:hypothetical protein
LDALTSNDAALVETAHEFPGSAGMLAVEPERLSKSSRLVQARAEKLDDCPA